MGKCVNKACFYYSDDFTNNCLNYKKVESCGKHIIHSLSLKEYSNLKIIKIKGGYKLK